MLKITLDEGYVFDLLSINEVKISKAQGENIEKATKNYISLSNEIIDQIGEDLFYRIILSDQYQQLKEANEKTFELVDEVKYDNGLGKKVDDSNYNRYLKKVALQNKFFGKEIQEIKIGY